MEVVNKAGAFCIYKKSAAAKFAFVAPKYNEKGWMTDEGWILLETSASTGVDENQNPVYDWGSKSTFAIGMNDIALLFDDIGKSLVHDYKGTIKTLQFQPGAAGTKYEGTFMMSLREKVGDIDKRISVPVSAGEFAVLSSLLKTCPARMLGW